MKANTHHISIQSITLVFLCLFLLGNSMAMAQEFNSQQLRQEANKFMADYQQDNLSIDQLDQLELQSQELIKRLQSCERVAENEISQLVEIRAIEALQSDAQDPGPVDQEVPTKAATKEVDRQINAATQSLITCRLSSNQLEEVRVDLITKKQNYWINNLTQKQAVWEFSTESQQFNIAELSGVFPVNILYFLTITLGLLYYFIVSHVIKESLFKPFPESLWQVNLTTLVVDLIKLHGIPILLSLGYFGFAEQHKAHALILFLAVLVRDACLLLPIKLRALPEQSRLFNKYTWVSMAFLLLLSFAWNGLFFQSNSGVDLLADYALIMTPLFFLTCSLLVWCSWLFMQLIKNGMDYYVAVTVMAVAALCLVGYAFNYAGGAQYLMILAAGLMLVHWMLKIVNSLRRIFLTKRIRKLKQDDALKDATFAFPFWASLILSISSGIGGLVFLSWLGGVSEEVFKQAAFLFNGGFDIGSVRLIPKDIIIGLTIVLVLVTILNKIKLGIQNKWFNKSRLRKSSREVFSMLVWYIGITIAVFAGLTFAGFDISKLAIIAGALSVGIGFGLQNIVSNFVSGLILLFERPVTRGDWVEVGGTVGLIEKVKIRATRIRTFDNSEILVPNSELLSHHVTNWTLSNSIGRITLKVGVAYGSDVEHVKQILHDIASNNGQVMQREPYKHKVLFRAFGDSSLNFELRVMIKDIKKFLDVESEINFAIDKALRDAGITIPFPQRDLHIIDSSVIKVDANDEAGYSDESESKEQAPERTAESSATKRSAKQSNQSADDASDNKSEVEQMIEEDENRKKAEEEAKKTEAEKQHNKTSKDQEA